VVLWSPDDAAYKRAWRLVSAHYERRYGGIWDASGKDISRLCFASYDTHAYVNFNAEMFVMDSQQWYVEQAIKTAVQMITSAAIGTRHHTRLRAARLLGGYVGATCSHQMKPTAYWPKRWWVIRMISIEP
jgi:VirE N-terminal domain